MKIKTGSLLLALGFGLSAAIVVAGITGCAAGPDTSSLKHSPTDSKPTWSGDNHDQPVYTSPATAPATNNLPTEKSPP